MPSILDRSFKYVPAAQTDIRRTFRRHGWVGPEERRTGHHMTVQVEHIEAAPPPVAQRTEPPLYGLGFGLYGNTGGAIFG